MALTYPDAAFIGTILSALFIGVYVTVFGLYVKITRDRRAPISVIDYGLGLLFFLAFVAVTLDATQQFFNIMRPPMPEVTERLNAVTSTLSLTLDFISQMILVYRCWVVWGKSTWVGLPPAFLALSSYAIGLTVTISLAKRSIAFEERQPWWVPVGTTAMTISLAVNAIVSGLMISRIWYVYKQTKSAVEQAGRSLLWVSSILVESAVALFLAQLIYLLLYRFKHPAFALVAGPVTVLYGLNCTAIMVRVGMNRSFETKAPSTHHSSLMFGKALRSNTANTASDKTYAGSATELGSIPASEKRKYGNTYTNATDTTVVFDRV